MVVVALWHPRPHRRRRRRRRRRSGCCARRSSRRRAPTSSTTPTWSVTVEPAGTTAQSLAALPDAERDDPGFDAWLAPSPWPRDRRRPAEARTAAAPVRASRRIRSGGRRSCSSCAPTATLCSRRRRRAAARSTGGASARSRGGPGRSSRRATGVGHREAAYGDPTTSAVALLVLARPRASSSARPTTHGPTSRPDEYLDWLSGSNAPVPSLLRTRSWRCCSSFRPRRTTSSAPPRPKPAPRSRPPRPTAGGS